VFAAGNQFPFPNAIHCSKMQNHFGNPYYVKCKNSRPKIPTTCTVSQPLQPQGFSASHTLSSQKPVAIKVVIWNRGKQGQAGEKRGIEPKLTRGKIRGIDRGRTEENRPQPLPRLYSPVSPERCITPPMPSPSSPSNEKSRGKHRSGYLNFARLAT
jgi:hypothetical protein